MWCFRREYVDRPQTSQKEKMNPKDNKRSSNVRVNITLN